MGGTGILKPELAKVVVNRKAATDADIAYGVVGAPTRAEVLVKLQNSAGSFGYADA